MFKNRASLFYRKYLSEPEITQKNQKTNRTLTQRNKRSDLGFCVSYNKINLSGGTSRLQVEPSGAVKEDNFHPTFGNLAKVVKSWWVSRSNAT